MIQKANFSLTQKVLASLCLVLAALGLYLYQMNASGGNILSLTILGFTGFLLIDLWAAQKPQPSAPAQGGRPRNPAMQARNCSQK